MEIKYYLSIIKRWVWLIILGLVLGAVGGYVVNLRTTPIYKTSTQVLVMSAPSQVTFDAATYYYEYQLAQTYMQLIKTTPFIEIASEKLGYNVSKGQVNVRQTENTQIMEVSAEDTDPQKAMDIAQQIAKAAPLGVQGCLKAARFGLENPHDQDKCVKQFMVDLIPVMNSEDATEGVNSFIERREAVFKGR